MDFLRNGLKLINKSPIRSNNSESQSQSRSTRPITQTRVRLYMLQTLSTQPRLPFSSGSPRVSKRERETASRVFVRRCFTMRAKVKSHLTLDSERLNIASSLVSFWFFGFFFTTFSNTKRLHQRLMKLIKWVLFWQWKKKRMRRLKRKRRKMRQRSKW